MTTAPRARLPPARRSSGDAAQPRPPVVVGQRACPRPSSPGSPPGWRSSPSWKAQPVRSTSACATEVFPTPDTPITTRVRGRGTACERRTCRQRGAHRTVASSGRRHLRVGSNMCSNVAMRWSGQQVLDDGVGSRAGPARPARAAAHRTRARVRRYHVPRGRGEVRAEPGAGRLAGALPLDREPVPGLRPRLRLLPRRRHARAARRRSHRPIADLRPGDAVLGTARCDAGRGAPLRAAPPVLAHWSTTKPGLPGHARGRHHAGGQRRAPLPDPAADGGTWHPGGAGPGGGRRLRRGRRPARSGCAARAPRPHCVLPAGLPARPGPRGRGGRMRVARRPDRPGLPVGARSSWRRWAGPTTSSPPRRPITAVRAPVPAASRPRRARAAPAAQGRPRRRCRAGRSHGRRYRVGCPSGATAGSGAACVVRPTRTTTGAPGCSAAWRTPRAPPPRAFSG